MMNHAKEKTVMVKESTEYFDNDKKKPQKICSATEVESIQPTSKLHKVKKLNLKKLNK